MELKSYADILSLHTRFAEEFKKRTAELREQLPKSPERLIAAKRAAIKQALDAAKAAERSKEEVVRRLDARISNLLDDASRLDREIEALEKELPSPPKRSSGSKSKR